MTTARAVITGLLAIVVLEAAGAERQPSISQIAATVTQLGSGWTSSRVVALIDPLCSPSEMADENEDPQGFLRLARSQLQKQPRREAYAILRYYGGSTGRYHTNALVYIVRWKSKADIGNDWGYDKETKDSPGALPKIGEEVRFSQRHGMHNNITFRRGSYLIDVEGPIVYGVEYLKRLAEVLDSNFLEAQKTLGAGGEVPGAQK